MSRDQDDRIESRLRALRRAEPPAAPDALVTGLVEAFEQQHVRPRTLGFAWRVAAAIALLVVAAALRGVQEPNSRDVIEADVALMESRLLRLAAEVDALRENHARRLAAMTPSTPESTDDLIARLGARDPSLLRYVSARRLEPLDRGGAVERYEQMVTTYPDGPAARLARERLVALSETASTEDHR